MYWMLCLSLGYVDSELTLLTVMNCNSVFVQSRGAQAIGAVNKGGACCTEGSTNVGCIWHVH
jgi:hypothetical protein